VIQAGAMVEFRVMTLPVDPLRQPYFPVAFLAALVHLDVAKKMTLLHPLFLSLGLLASLLGVSMAQD
jgi:hypothetical protein